MFCQWVRVLFSFHKEGARESGSYGGSESQRFVKLG